MKFTHQELLQAVRTAAQGHESFTSADVRKQLGVETRDKRALGQFQQSFRNFRKTLGTDLEKLSNNRYRLREDALVMSEAREQVGLSLADAPSDVAVAMSEACAQATAELHGEFAPLPATASTHDVTQPPAGRGSWRERAQRLGRRVVRLVSNIGFGARTAA
jgi:hypothetical protein